MSRKRWTFPLAVAGVLLLVAIGIRFLATHDSVRNRPAEALEKGTEAGRDAPRISLLGPKERAVDGPRTTPVSHNQGGNRPPPTAPTPRAIEGRVEDEAHRPVEGARVWRTKRGMEADSTLTDATGRFSFQPEYGQCVVQAMADGFARSPKVIIQEQYEGPLVLVLEQPHYLAGKISDGHGKPFSGVMVSVVSFDGDYGSSGSATTGSDGRYRIEGLSNLDHFVTLSHPSGVREGVGETNVDRDDADFVLGATLTTLYATVLDPVTNLPAKDVSLDVRGGDQKAEVVRSDLGFVIRNLQPGYYTFLITTPDGRFASPGQMSIPPNTPEMHQTFRLEKAATVAGRVIVKPAQPGEDSSATAARPVPKAIVYVELGGSYEPGSRPELLIQSAITDAEGRFSAKVPMGHYQLTVVPPPPLASDQNNVEVLEEHVDAGDIQVSLGSAVSGKIVDESGNVPASGYRITCQWERLGQALSTNRIRLLSLKTDSSGAFETPPLGAGKLSIRVLDPRLSQTFQLRDSEDREITIRLGSARLTAQGDPARNSLMLDARLRLVASQPDEPRDRKSVV